MIDMLLRGLSTQIRVIGALAVREVRLKNTKFAFSYFFDILETMFIIIGISIFFVYLQRDPIIGDSVFMFVTTGILPIYVFKTISVKTSMGVKQSKSTKAIAFITIIDMAIAKMMVETFKYIFLALVLFTAYTIAEISEYSVPVDMIAILQALLIIELLALGCGLAGAFIQFFFPLWAVIWSIIARSQMFLAGVFQVPEYSLPMIRDLLAWNPLAHAVGLFRMGFYPTYPRFFVDTNYAMLCALAVFVLGLMIERAFKNRAAIG